MGIQFEITGSDPQSVQFQVGTLKGVFLYTDWQPNGQLNILEAHGSHIQAHNNGSHRPQRIELSVETVQSGPVLLEFTILTGVDGRVYFELPSGYSAEIGSTQHRTFTFLTNLDTPEVHDHPVSA